MSYAIFLFIIGLLPTLLIARLLIAYVIRPVRKLFVVFKTSGRISV